MYHFKKRIDEVQKNLRSKRKTIQQETPKISEKHTKIVQSIYQIIENYTTKCKISAIRVNENGKKLIIESSSSFETKESVNEDFFEQSTSFNDALHETPMIIKPEPTDATDVLVLANSEEDDGSDIQEDEQGDSDTWRLPNSKKRVSFKRASTSTERFAPTKKSKILISSPTHITMKMFSGTGDNYSSSVEIIFNNPRVAVEELHRFYKSEENSNITYEFVDGQATRIIWFERHDAFESRMKMLAFLKNAAGFERLLFKKKRHSYVIFQTVDYAKKFLKQVDGRIVNNSLIRCYFAYFDALKNEKLIKDGFFEAFPERNFNLEVQIDNFLFDEIVKVSILKDENNNFEKIPKKMNIEDVYIENEAKNGDLKNFIQEKWGKFSIGLTFENNLLEMVMTKSKTYFIEDIVTQNISITIFSYQSEIGQFLLEKIGDDVLNSLKINGFKLIIMIISIE
ncbi:hypothetical protein PVAND_000902 [Polypedilum vanderplanki]|uniref:Uncharacterized protein n=1 Tax=Polypedilum vanderplanki TaxID=319348 RepID=A0A9J6BMM3_POLVA|nr:hypothetical protein PVAND_000902 [Polypedilum vanderplanki]